MDPGPAVAAGQLWSPRDITERPETPNALKVVLEWVSSYIVKPHTQLGRKGVVCPFVPSSLAFNVLWFALLPGVPADEREMCETVTRYMRIYEKLPVPCERARDLTTLILVCSDITQAQAISLVGHVHQQMKPTLVGNGHMLGEFYAANEAHGVHNEAFRPLRSPIPLLVYRQMVPNDLVFLTEPTDPPQQRINFVSAYLRVLGDRLSDERAHEARSALAAAERELRADAALVAG
jgi:hypothetical protein